MGDGPGPVRRFLCRLGLHYWYITTLEYTWVVPGEEHRACAWCAKCQKRMYGEPWRDS